MDRSIMEKNNRTREFKSTMEKSRQFSQLNIHGQSRDSLLHARSRLSLHKSSYDRNSSIDEYSEEDPDFVETIIQEKLDDYDLKK